MIELETQQQPAGGLAQDMTLVRRRRMTGLNRGTTVAALRSRRPGPLRGAGIVRGDIRRGFGTSRGVARGVPFAIRLRLVSANSGRPLPGYAVYLWHADRDGAYALHDLTDQNYLRGVQVADSAGWVRFTSVFPGLPEGGWPHVRFEVRLGPDLDRPLLAGELTLPVDACTTAYAVPGYERSRANLATGSLTGPMAMCSVTGDVRRGLVATRTITMSTTRP